MTTAGLSHSKNITRWEPLNQVWGTVSDTLYPCNFVFYAGGQCRCVEHSWGEVGVDFHCFWRRWRREHWCWRNQVGCVSDWRICRLTWQWRTEAKIREVPMLTIALGSNLGGGGPDSSNIQCHVLLNCGFWFSVFLREEYCIILVLLDIKCGRKICKTGCSHQKIV